MLEKSKLQQCVATSSMQSEYMALCAATLQSLWLITIIRTIGYNKLNPITLLEDNQSCIQYTKNNTDHDKTKHIDIKFRLVCEQVKLGNISIAKIPTKNYVADLLTTPLYGDLFWQHLSSGQSLINDKIKILRSTDVTYCCDNFYMSTR